MEKEKLLVGVLLICHYESKVLSTIPPILTTHPTHPKQQCENIEHGLPCTAGGVGATLTLYFWVVVTRRDIFPVFKNNFCYSAVSPVSATSSAAEGTGGTGGGPGGTAARVYPARFDEDSLGHVNYLGFVNQHQSDLYQVLNGEIEAER